MDRVKADAASLGRIGQRRLIAILRADRADALIPAAEALLAGGVDVVEFALPRRRVSDPGCPAAFCQ
jgi:2-keto-3-deoxy-6-phosphogluconate aldolase